MQCNGHVEHVGTLQKKEKFQIAHTILQVKMAIEKGNMDGARIYAENSIRCKTQGLNYLRLAGRVDAVAARVETAVRMQQITKSMSGVVQGMDQALKSMNLEEISNLMDRFDKTFESLDVQSMTMEQSMQSTNSMSTPVDQVDTLIQQVAQEHGLEVGEQLGGVPQHAPPSAAKEQDELTARLERLKSGGGSGGM
jgi:charged multivesicular body protein 1